MRLRAHKNRIAAGLGRETNKRIADAWRVAFGSGHRSVDDEEFLITTELVASTLACLASTPISSIPDFRLFYSKLRLFCELQQEYESHVIRSDQLMQFQTNRTTRRKVSRLNSHVHMEIKWVLAASGVTNSLRESLAIRKRSLGRISVPEGQAMWEAHFSDLDMDMVPWDRFLGAFMMHTKQTVDMHDEILLKHILDNDTLGTVTPKQFSSFLKCFGPLEKSLENVKNLYKQKWFHDFLSVEEVHKLLTEQPPGTFLVRFSRSHSNSFALEYTYTTGKVFTVLIRNDMPNGVYIKEENNVEKMFPNLDSLIKHYPDILKSPFQNDIVIQPWFVGDVSTEEAEEMLASKPPGTFMVRFAASGRFQYACSYATMQGVKHTMIQKGPNGYIIEETRAAPTPSLITTGVSVAAANTSNGSPDGDSSASSSASTTPSPLPTSSSPAWSSNASSATPTVYPSLEQFLRVAGAELRYNYDADNVPNLKVSEFMETDRYVDLSGPHDSDGNGADGEFQGGSKVYAKTVASYPKICLGWEVVCDQWHIRLLGNRIVFALADGCNWGTKVRQAADAACRAIIDQVADRDVQSRIRDTMEARHFLLRSFSVAHEQVVNAGAGTTTLLAGILMEVDPNSDEWALVAASVGDCKALVYMQGADRCVDVTLGNRRNLRDARDPGGRLGDADGQKQPDLRNLQSYFWPMRRNDILMLVSDGIHDNLDPEAFGKQPHELASYFATNLQPHLATIAAKAKSWDDLDQDTTEKLKSGWMLSRLHGLIKAKDMNAKTVTNALIDYAMTTTSPSRTFMEANPDKPEPTDHVAYPGKMDHVSCLAFAVGPLFKDLVAWRHRPMVARPMPATSSMNQLALGSGLAGSAVAAGAKKIAIVVQEDPRSEARKQNMQSSATSASGSTSMSVSDISRTGGGGGVGSSSDRTERSAGVSGSNSYTSGSAASTSTVTGSASHTGGTSTSASTMLTSTSYANSASYDISSTASTSYRGNYDRTTNVTNGGAITPAFFAGNGNAANGGAAPSNNSRPTSPYHIGNQQGSASPIGSSQNLLRTVTSPGLTFAPLTSTPMLFQPLAGGVDSGASSPSGSAPSTPNSTSRSQYQLLPGRTISSYLDLLQMSFPVIPLAPYSQDYSLQIGNAFPGDCELSCSSLACGRSNSTYPYEPVSSASPSTAATTVSTATGTATMSPTRKRLGDPNTTTFCLDASPTRITFAVTVGSNWGAAAAEASYRACHSSFHTVLEEQNDIETSRDAAIQCLRAFDRCQQSISETSPDAHASVMMLTGMLAQAAPTVGGGGSVPSSSSPSVVPPATTAASSSSSTATTSTSPSLLSSAELNKPRWMSIFVTLGSNKVYVWKRSTQKIIDLTAKREGMDRREPGGFLSTDPRNNPTLLKNLCVSFGDVDPDDILIVTTPGCYQNFDPEMLGVPTKSEHVSPPLKETEWSATLEDHIQARANYRIRIMEQLLAQVYAEASKQPSTSATHFDEPKRFAVAIIDYCKRVTSAVRDFMEANPKATEPKDRAQYPGKMGHAMCLAIRANRLTDFEVQHAATASSRSALISTQARPIAKKT